MDVIVKATDIPDDNWYEMIRLSSGYPARYIVETYNAEHTSGTWNFKFSREKYVEFCLRWL